MLDFFSFHSSTWLWCSQTSLFANKIPCLTPGLSWNAPSSSESIYPKITVLIAQRARYWIYLVVVLSLTVVFLFQFLFFYFSLPESICIVISIFLWKSYYFRRWPFLICLGFHFLATWRLMQNKNQDVSRKDRACPEVRGFRPLNIVFTVTPPGKKNDKWRQRGRSRDRLPPSVLSLNVTYTELYQVVFLSCLQKFIY